MLPKILFAVSAAVAVLAVVVATRPPSFHIERSILVAAPTQRAFAYVNDLRAWRAWSPWENVDPTLQRTYEGPAAGVGASYAWSGSKIGVGKMTIEEAVPGSRLALLLEFEKPMPATNHASFSFTPAPGGSRVTWVMEGRCNLLQRTAGVFMNIDEMVGRDFERGLAALKALAEAPVVAATR